ncbi:MAG: hypothetical protein IT405_03790 [Candidatus Yanofskybacteria bacterium]|nr:hypothetical protein [Candidatus Yanofskybacteria bacterium]
MTLMVSHCFWLGNVPMAWYTEDNGGPMLGTACIEAKLDKTNVLLRQLLDEVRKVNANLEAIKTANQEHFEERQKAHKPHR